MVGNARECGAVPWERVGTWEISFMIKSRFNYNPFIPFSYSAAPSRHSHCHCQCTYCKTLNFSYGINQLTRRDKWRETMWPRPCLARLLLMKWRWLLCTVVVYALLIIAQSSSSVHVREQIIYIFLTILCTLSRAFTYLVTPWKWFILFTLCGFLIVWMVVCIEGLEIELWWRASKYCCWWQQLEV